MNDETKIEIVSDHDLLIRIDERVQKIDRCLSDHLHRHWTIAVAAIGAMLTAMVSVFIVLMK